MEEKRERWDSRSAFILAAIGSAIGLGNVWRFPYIAYENGGGAFLIPYFIALLTVGIPMLILEMAVGQKWQGGAPTAFRRARKWFEWVGWFAILVATIITFYYCAIMAWSMNYLIHAFSTKWSTWITPEGLIEKFPDKTFSGPEEAFWKEEIMHLSDSPDMLGTIPWPLIIGLALTWVLVYLAIRKGVHSVGKVVLVTVPLPFLLLAILLIKGITLPNMVDGLVAYLTPNVEVLKDPKVWAAAYGQIFFSLSVGFGVMTAYASFRPRKSDVVNNAFITGLANCGTSFFAGFAVFSILGYMASAQQPPAEVTEVVSGGLGLAFITFPKAIYLLGNPWAMLAGILFFLMLLTLGIDSAFSLVEAAGTAFADEVKIKRHTVTVILCIVGFIAGLLFINQAGLYWLDIVDNWMNSWGLIVVVFFEATLFGWFFYDKSYVQYLAQYKDMLPHEVPGKMKEAVYNRWLRNLDPLVNYMDKYSEIKSRGWWPFMVKFVAPPILGVIIILNFINEMKSPYSGYPTWALWLGGWGLIMLMLVLSGVLTVAREGKLPKPALGISIVAVIIYISGFILTYPGTESWRTWLMGIIGGLILYGGVAICLMIASKHRGPEPEEIDDFSDLKDISD